MSRTSALLPAFAALALGGPAGITVAQPQEPPPETLPPPLMEPPEEIEPIGRGYAFEASSTVTFEGRVVELVNARRLTNGGLPPLKSVDELFTSSETHSFNMADRDFFAHCDVDTKKSPFTRMTEAGYFWSFASENLAGGQGSPESVMTAWMNSPGHRANILHTGFRELGVGYYEQAADQTNVRLDQNGDCNADATACCAFFRYWTQNFGSRNGVYPLVINRESHDTVCAEVELYVYGPSNAVQMRFSNDGSDWSAWMPYSPDATWTIPGSSASPATVFSQVSTGGTIFTADDSIELEAGFPATSNLVLTSQTVDWTADYQACDTITARDGFVVGSAGDVTFLAGRRVALRGGFAVDGGTFNALVASTL